MKVKNLLAGVLGRHMLRHRQHRRFLTNALMQARYFGPGKGLLLLGAIAYAGRYMQKRHASRQAAQFPETGVNY